MVLKYNLGYVFNKSRRKVKMNIWTKAECNFNIDKFKERFGKDLVDLDFIIDLNTASALNRKVSTYSKLLHDRGFVKRPTNEYPRMFVRSDIDETTFVRAISEYKVNLLYNYDRTN